ncbi:hypothetical protein HK096_006133 [Nowakowskiella sp. JEL0078]|nr:hypothetical protein HK096_006133 [Nowakowskiella sp. JEL0078]
MFSKWSSKKTPSPSSSPVPSPVNSLSRSSASPTPHSPPSSPQPGSSPAITAGSPQKLSARGRQMVPLNDQKDKDDRGWGSKLRLRSLSKHRNRQKSPDGNSEVDVKKNTLEPEKFEKDLLELPVLNDMAPLSPLTKTLDWFHEDEIKSLVTSMDTRDAEDNSELSNVLLMRNSLADSHATLNDEDDKITSPTQSKIYRDLPTEVQAQQTLPDYGNSMMEDWRNSQTASLHSSITYVDHEKITSPPIVSPISTAARYTKEDDDSIDENFSYVDQYDTTFDESQNESNLDKNVNMLRHHGRSRVSVLDIEKMMRDLDFSVDQLQQDAMDLESLEAELKATRSPSDTEISSQFDFNTEEAQNENKNADINSDGLDRNKSSNGINLLGVKSNANVIADQQSRPLSPDPHPFIPTSGYLSKLQQKGVFKTWKRRFFILSPNRIYYFQSQNQTDTALGHIVLNSKSDCFVSGHSSFEGKHVFEIVTPLGEGSQQQTKSVFLLCDGKDEMLNWIKGIRNSILKQRANKDFVAQSIPTQSSLSRESDKYGTLESTSTNSEKFDTLDSVNSFSSLERFRNQLQRNSSTGSANSIQDIRPQSFQQANSGAATQINSNFPSGNRSLTSPPFSPVLSYNPRMDPSLAGLHILAEISSSRQSFSPLSQTPVGSWENQELSNTPLLFPQRQNSGRLPMNPSRFEEFNSRRSSSVGYSNSMSSRHQGVGRGSAPIDSSIKSALDLLDQIDISQRGRNSDN